MRRLSWVVILAAAVCAMPLSADALRVISPRAGATMRGGSFAALQWTAGALPPRAEEWEAFLSLDGGRYYAFRITPHLDIDRRAFDFLVPNVDTNDVRILIRTGDERHETLVELPDRFSIVRDDHADLPMHVLAGAGRAEAARQGDPLVVAWAEGDRAASRVTEQASTEGSTSIVATNGQESMWPSAAGPKLLRALSAIELTVEGAPLVRQFVSGCDRIHSENLLLFCRRLNI
jgi:hypothetical protein